MSAVKAAVELARPAKFVEDKTVDAANVPANDVLDVAVTVAGVRSKDFVMVHAPALEDDLGISHAWVSANNTVTVRLVNPTGGAVNPASQTWTIVVL